MHHLAIAVTLLTLAVQFPLIASEPVQWKRIQLDPVFRSEGATAFDVNRDGKIDVVAGELWYEAPDWVAHEIQPVGQYLFDTGYSSCFGCFGYDVDGDQWQDYIVVGFPGQPCHWYQNPQNRNGHWQKHEIWQVANNESPTFADLTDDGTPELILGSDNQLGFLPLPSQEAAKRIWKFRPISTPGNSAENGSATFYHGLGYGDLNGDGRPDVLIPHGWYQNPCPEESGPWKFHPFALKKPIALDKPGSDSPLLAAHLFTDDLDLDGDQDIVMSSAHEYGIWWLENLGGEENTEFQYHLIDESFSQTHALQMADIDGDGDDDFVTGKRFFAHNGNDPGGQDAVVMYWVEVQRTRGAPPTFTMHEIEAGRNTGIGTQFTVQDVTGDGLFDIVLANKKGVNLLIQMP